MIMQRIALAGKDAANADRLLSAGLELAVREPAQSAPRKRLFGKFIALRDQRLGVQHHRDSRALTIFTERTLLRMASRGSVMSLRFEGDRAFSVPPEQLWPKLRDAGFLVHCIP